MAVTSRCSAGRKDPGRSELGGIIDDSSQWLSCGVFGVA